MNPVPKPGRARVLVARAVLALPFALVGVGVGVVHVPAGLVAAGLMMWAETRLSARDGR